MSDIENNAGEMVDDVCSEVDKARIEIIVDKVNSAINKLPEDKQGQIHLLKIKRVILWIFGFTTFLEPDNRIESYGTKDTKVQNGFYKNGNPKYKKIKVVDEGNPKYKYNIGEFNKKLEENEAKWNMNIMKEIRPDLYEKESKQKSKFGLFGEILVKEYYILTGEFLTDKPEKKGGHDLDLETKKEMIEVKTGSYFTTGTAGEKVPGVPWKYSEVPDLYEKPLLIILIGGDKKESELVCESTPKKEKMKKIWKEEFDITFTCFKKLLNNL